MDESIDVRLGRRLRNRRRLLGRTQSEIAQVCGVSFQQVQKYESGLSRMSAVHLWRLSQCLQVPMSYFFEGLPVEEMGSGRPKGGGEDALGSPERPSEK